MASIKALEKSFQKNCSLNRSHGGGESSDEEEDLITTNTSTTTLELNSHLTLPHQWEQCLDLKTGEIYYINWADGTKKKEDPRKKREDSYYHYQEEEEDKSYESHGSSSASSPCHDYYYNNNNDSEGVVEEIQGEEEREREGDHILVVAGCKTCMMYFMLPKRVQQCPKCNGFLLHFDRLENGSL